MIVHPSDIHPDFGKAKIGFCRAARDLDLDINCQLASMWRVEIDRYDLKTFLELAREAAK